MNICISRNISLVLVVFLHMLTNEEEGFIVYWEKNREQQKKWFKQFAIGLPIGLIFGSAILLNVFSDWNNQIKMINRGQLVTMIIAVLLIIAFISIFTVKHKWDLREQHYRELLAKKKKQH
jgi:ATP/ADP translocase